MLKQSVKRDPRDLAAYTHTDAARYLDMPRSTIRNWVGTNGIVQPAGALLSFNNLVELHTLGSLRRVHGIKPEKIRNAIAYVSERMGVDRPLLHGEFSTDGVDLFVERGGLVSASRPGQVPIQDVIRSYLKRVDWDDMKAPIRLFPLSEAQSDTERLIAIDPIRSFGKPMLVGTGVPTHILVARFRGRESMQELADDYDIPLDKVEAAIRWELAQKAAA